MKTLSFLAATFLTSATAMAFEAESPVPSTRWSGFYVAGYAGGAWAESDIATSVGDLTTTSYFVSLDNIASVERNASGSLNESSFVGGIQIGGNLQRDRWVYGAEIDFGAMNMDGSLGADNVVYPDLNVASYSVRSSFSTDWLMTARLRLGYAVSDSLLLYVTGGYALIDLTVANSFNDTSGTDGIGGGTSSDRKSGWVVGGGLELALDRNWSIKGEYLHLDFGSVSSNSSIACGPDADPNVGCDAAGGFPSAFNTRADLSVDSVRGGLAYKF